MWYAKILTAFCIIAAPLAGEIHEMNTIEELSSYIDDETLIIFDIDNTIVAPAQTVGSDQWFYPRIVQHQAQGLSFDSALTRALLEWEALQSVTTVVLVEKETSTIISTLQRRGLPVMGLTTRGHRMELATQQQLSSLCIDLSLTAPSKHSFFFTLGQHIFYDKGVLFTNNDHKGRALFTFLDKECFLPNRIIFINDKAKDLQMVEETCLIRGVPFTGLRYGYTDHAAQNVDMSIAGIQIDKFLSILSDSEAAALLE